MEETRIRLKSVRPKAQQFLKGPIPLYWLIKSSQLPGKACALAVALWYMKGVTGRSTFELKSSLCKKFNIKQDAKIRALNALEEANLISVVKQRGKPTIVTVLSREITYENNSSTGAMPKSI